MMFINDQRRRSLWSYITSTKWHTFNGIIWTIFWKQFCLCLFDEESHIHQGWHSVSKW